MVFETLKNRKVAEGFDREKKLRNFLGKLTSDDSELCLFDFVDVDSINELRENTKKDLESYKSKCENCFRTISALEDKVILFEEKLKKDQHRKTNTQDIAKVQEMVRVQNQISDKMAEILLEIAAHYDSSANILKFSLPLLVLLAPFSFPFRG